MSKQWSISGNWLCQSRPPTDWRKLWAAMHQQAFDAARSTSPNMARLMWAAVRESQQPGGLQQDGVVVLASELIHQLDGLTIAEAQQVLDSAKTMLCAAHRVDITATEQFAAGLWPSATDCADD